MSEVRSEEQAIVSRTNTESTKESAEVMKKTEQQDRETDIIRQEVRQVISEFSGPLPPPNIIKGYEDILPGSADRILTMAEEQSRHRQSMEKKMIEAESRDSLLGVLFAFALGIGCLIAACIIVIVVPQNAGAISSALFGTAGICSIVVPFLKIRNSPKDDEKDIGDSSSI